MCSPGVLFSSEAALDPQPGKNKLKPPSSTFSRRYPSGTYSGRYVRSVWGRMELANKTRTRPRNPASSAAKRSLVVRRRARRRLMISANSQVGSIATW
jgi:hypothetical protein